MRAWTPWKNLASCGRTMTFEFGQISNQGDVMCNFNYLCLAAVVAAILVCSGCSAGETRELHFKSPEAGMRFTAGLSLQVWADIIPRDDEHPGWPQAECRWDNELIGGRVNANPKAFDYFPFTIPAAKVTPGIHKLKLNGFGVAGPTVPPEET